MVIDLARVAASWADSADFDGELVEVRHVPARQAIYAEPAVSLPGPITEQLGSLGIDRLYRHQARALDLIRGGRHTVIVAGTAAGKTLCYQIPIAEAFLADPASTALCLYPTKALAQDQARSFSTMAMEGMSVATYDGDTPPDERPGIRRSAGVILTNPDMLHVGVLPHHGGWGDFLHRLRYVVVDEVHTLRGIFGTHVAMVLRRLRRLCAHYGSEPTFVFGSATIGNPGQLASDLCGLDVEVVDQDDSPRGEQWVALWNPEMTDPEEGRRRSALAEATDLFVDLVRRDVSTIVFARSRKATELIYRWAGERLDAEQKGRIASYRGGYLARERRRIEERLFGGDLVGVVTTNALELGIDVASLEAAILTTFPGTISSFRQQAGRAGRSQAQALVTLVAGEDALDQYYMTHPSQLFERPPEAVVINPENPTVAEAHAGCAAYELPLRLEDREILGGAMEEAANRLVQSEYLRLRDDALYWSHRRRPAPQIDLRSSSGRRFEVVDRTGRPQLLGILDEARAYRDGHEGAVYLHQGETYVSERLDVRRGEVTVVRKDVAYYTQPKVESDLEVLERQAVTDMGRVKLHLGHVRVHSQVVAYQKKALGSRETLDMVYLDLPSVTYETAATWLAIPDAILRRAAIDHIELPGTLHAAEHAGIAVLPLRAVCDRWDLGGLSTPWHPATGGPAIFIHEAYAGGAGISQVAFAAGTEHWQATLEAIRTCPCVSGCPSCIQSPKCGNFNEPLDKAGAVRLLEATL
ncbi:MAG TPA: DEAD/DEAH box helicase [Acidimicrobiia bacterium]|nr:DEAD/DEAH box helicase [Acidimicrobiia bacterium]